ncbi:MAG: YutD-like domain-containing protein [Bacilli bacterium]
MNSELVNQYEVIEIYKFDDWQEDFSNRYVDLYGKYDYILGDLSAGILRLTGFYQKSFESEHKHHLKKVCAYDAPFFILKQIEE